MCANSDAVDVTVADTVVAVTVWCTDCPTRLTGYTLKGALTGWWLDKRDGEWVFCYRYRRKPMLQTVRKTFVRAMNILHVPWVEIVRVDYCIDVVTDKLVPCVWVTFTV